jgi:vacuolar-type H+-ATPase subunit F/Vma7
MSNHSKVNARQQKLVVIANRQTTMFFTLVGAVGFEIDQDEITSEFSVEQALRPAINFIRNNVRTIGAILVASEYADTLVERIERMRGVEIPIVQLPDKTGASQADRLESIMEKAVGMKLDLNAFSSTNK